MPVSETRSARRVLSGPAVVCRLSDWTGGVWVLSPTAPAAPRTGHVPIPWCFSCARLNCERARAVAHSLALPLERTPLTHLQTQGSRGSPGHPEPLGPQRCSPLPDPSTPPPTLAHGHSLGNREDLTMSVSSLPVSSLPAPSPGGPGQLPPSSAPAAVASTSRKPPAHGLPHRPPGPSLLSRPRAGDSPSQTHLLGS